MKDGGAGPAISCACDTCLARAWLLARLAGHLELERARIEDVLALADDELIEALAGVQRDVVAAEHSRLEIASLRKRAASSQIEPICRCHAAYPAPLRASPAPPAVLYVGGGLERFLALSSGDPVAIVGARRASGYGVEVARTLGRGLASAGVAVVSGLALGIDSAAHAGALSAEGPTIAVLPCGADRPYPTAKRAIYNRIRAAGSLVSELPPGAPVWRWTFPARNRIIAALSAMTVVVEAGERSGALITADHALRLGRPVGAVPGRVTSSLAAGPNRLLANGANLVGDAQDVLDVLFGEGIRKVPVATRAPLDQELERLLAAVSDGCDTIAALARAGFDIERGFAALSELELAGYVRREPGGRYSVLT